MTEDEKAMVWLVQCTGPRGHGEIIPISRAEADDPLPHTDQG